ncbi:hypothetical protein [Streptomyces sp. NPDC046985]|uniref:hypothetical protein n=1 Tax=Streptomyces sp. NPDC046985 TaxID=3155377 RepID=UPI0033E47D80
MVAASAPSAAQNRPRPSAAAEVCMSDLLAACAAAEAVSRPPRAPALADPRPAPGPAPRGANERRRAALPEQP